MRREKTTEWNVEEAIEVRGWEGDKGKVRRGECEVGEADREGEEATMWEEKVKWRWKRQRDFERNQKANLDLNWIN